MFPCRFENAAPAVAAASNNVTETLTSYQAKIEGLWEGYKAKQATEAELLAKSDKILQNLAEAVEKAQEQAAASAGAASEQQQQTFLALLLARLLALFQAVKQFVQQLVAKLTGGGSSGGAAAGASA